MKNKLAIAEELYNALRTAASIIGHPDCTMSIYFQELLEKARKELNLP